MCSREFFLPRSKRLFNWKNVFDVNDGELAAVCNKDDSIFWMASEMSFPSFSSTDNFFLKRSRSLYDAGELSGLGVLEMTTGETEIEKKVNCL